MVTQNIVYRRDDLTLKRIHYKILEVDSCYSAVARGDLNALTHLVSRLETLLPIINAFNRKKGKMKLYKTEFEKVNNCINKRDKYIINPDETVKKALELYHRIREDVMPLELQVSDKGHKSAKNILKERATGMSASDFAEDQEDEDEWEQEIYTD